MSIKGPIKDTAFLYPKRLKEMASPDYKSLVVDARHQVVEVPSIFADDLKSKEDLENLTPPDISTHQHEQVTKMTEATDAVVLPEQKLQLIDFVIAKAGYSPTDAENYRAEFEDIINQHGNIFEKFFLKLKENRTKDFSISEELKKHLAVVASEALNKANKDKSKEDICDLVYEALLAEPEITKLVRQSALVDLAPEFRKLGDSYSEDRQYYFNESEVAKELSAHFITHLYQDPALAKKMLKAQKDKTAGQAIGMFEDVQKMLPMIYYELKHEDGKDAEFKPPFRFDDFSYEYHVRADILKKLHEEFLSSKNLHDNHQPFSEMEEYKDKLKEKMMPFKIHMEMPDGMTPLMQAVVIRNRITNFIENEKKRLSSIVITKSFTKADRILEYKKLTRLNDDVNELLKSFLKAFYPELTLVSNIIDANFKALKEKYNEQDDFLKRGGSFSCLSFVPIEIEDGSGSKQKECLVALSGAKVDNANSFDAHEALTEFAKKLSSCHGYTFRYVPESDAFLDLLLKQVGKGLSGHGAPLSSVKYGEILPDFEKSCAEKRLVSELRRLFLKNGDKMKILGCDNIALPIYSDLKNQDKIETLAELKATDIQAIKRELDQANKELGEANKKEEAKKKKEANKELDEANKKEEASMKEEANKKEENKDKIAELKKKLKDYDNAVAQFTLRTTVDGTNKILKAAHITCCSSCQAQKPAVFTVLFDALEKGSSKKQISEAAVNAKHKTVAKR